MIGFVIGTLCLIGLVKVLRRARYGGGGPFAFGHCGPGRFGGGWGGGSAWGGGGWGGYGGGSPWGHGDHAGDYRHGWHGEAWRGGSYDDVPEGDRRGRHGGWGAWAGRQGQRFFLRGLFERLDTTPGQEKVIVAAFDDLRAAADKVREEMHGARTEVATAMRGESFDEVALGGATARVEHGIDTMRRAGIDAFAKIHEALDERQRGRLADLLQHGPRGFGY
ncbi:Spy/CpxP family protein refolding chaperone [Pendulispora albinea]|uniref:Periplasmic heavy metal sensor n=1 Tax=Pendulispora albinea TaxID=2741071 RepID=A0ABZ2LQQ6_9BACT